MSVLLIGSTGMGKSTFGNYLLDPDEKHMFDNQTFATATDNKPMTQEVKAVNMRLTTQGGRKVDFQLIDTPGLNESAIKDLSHMIAIIKKLKESGEIRACILVVKFNAKIDAQYRATIEYYSKLLPGLFDKNVIIVMTDYATDERSEALRKRQHIDVEQVIRNTILELGQCSNQQITYSPQLFTIDCLPLGNDEIEMSRNVRKAILNYIFHLAPIRVKNQLVAKTDYVKQKDAEETQRVEGEINGYNERLKEVHVNSKKALDDIRQKEREITKIESKVKDLEGQLQMKDTAEDVVIERMSIEKRWKLFRRYTEDFNIGSLPHKITKHDTWTNGRCEFKDIHQTPETVKGKVEGEFMRGIYASVTAYTENRIKYAKEIQDWKGKLEEENTKLTECKEERDKYREENKKYKEEIELLLTYIDERRVAAAKFRSDLMTIEEAMARLEELKKET